MPLVTDYFLLPAVPAASSIMGRHSIPLNKMPISRRITSSGGARTPFSTAVWRSCSSKGNISINWKLAFQPKAALEYVVVHELCHLRHRGHTQVFWKALAALQPDYEDVLLTAQTQHLRLQRRVRARTMQSPYARS